MTAALAPPCRDSLADRDDRDLVAAYRDGDWAAYDVLLVRHRDRIRRVARATGAGALADADVDDIEQQVGLALFRHLASCRTSGTDRFTTWLDTVTRNTVRTQHRRAGCRPVCDGVDDPATLDRLAPAHDEVGYRDVETGDELAAALAALSDDHRVVLVLLDVHDLPVDEVAARLGVATGTVKSRHKRALDAVRRLLTGGPARRPRRDPQPAVEQAPVEAPAEPSSEDPADEQPDITTTPPARPPRFRRVRRAALRIAAVITRRAAGRRTGHGAGPPTPPTRGGSRRARPHYPPSGRVSDDRNRSGPDPTGIQIMTTTVPVGRAVPGIDPDDALEVLPHGEPRGDWLAVRRRGIGGSDASAVLGFNTHRSPLEVWDDKTGRGFLTPDNTPMHWGRLLEPVIRDDFAAERDLDIVVPGVLRSQRWPWMQTSLDGLCSDGALLEIKALDVATPMLTTRGWTTLGEVAAGDEVYHPDGHPLRVTVAHPVHGDRPCYRVSTSDDRSVVADADHLWTVQDASTPARAERWVTLTTRQLVESGLALTGGQSRWRLPRQRPVVSKPVDLPIDPYLLGVWLGDGHTAGARLTVGDGDLEEMLEHIRDAGVVDTTCTRISRPTGDAWAVGFRLAGRSFGRRCRDLGMYQEKRIPERYLSAGTEQRLALLQGLLDTDGGISARGQVTFSSSRHDLANDVLFLVRSLGWRATVRRTEIYLDGDAKQPAWRVRFTPLRPDPVPFRMSRKAERVQAADDTTKGHRQFRILSIEPVESRPVRCITVDSPDGLFLAGRDLLPTHNCTDYWGRQNWDDGQTPDHAEVQVQHNLAVTGLAGGWVRCFAGITSDAITRWIPRDDELIDDLVEIEREFWHDYVVAGVEPPAGGSEAVTDFLANRYPQPQIGTAVLANPDDVTFIRTGHGQRKAAESYGKEKAAENLARQLLGDSTELVDENGELVATWRQTGKFDAAAFEAANPKLAAEFRIKVDALDAKAIEKAHPDLYRAARGRVLLVK